jgi:hypothetical protein
MMEEKIVIKKANGIIVERIGIFLIKGGVNQSNTGANSSLLNSKLLFA